ncbi:purine-nucleoside phosphorylase [Falsirhodobacter algicola]|uniref:Uridine phosphorylase n=1 Tax=Falsirhodobacter algicola TaxID=2692330 RepID=A0A8J8SLR7_9RHOB|nr:purine-nucleoside phosphorylase [Falsirhodobacter algicola]QUS36656.1 purine-nucleoside phosphorylase [Falsirhodobacter algicola]
MTHHINPEAEIAETVLLPGDPLRARWVAQTFLQDAVEVNAIRGMYGYTGIWQGRRVTVQGTGMGMPSLSIYVNELIRMGARNLIRIGSAGGMQPDVKVRDLVLAMSACHAGYPSATIFRELCFAPTADFGLLSRAAAAAPEAHVGQIYSSDTFYDERADLGEQMRRHGVLAVEMEAAELYALAARHKVRALAVCTISDHLLTGESLPPEERERSFARMVEVALHAAHA